MPAAAIWLSAELSVWVAEGSEAASEDEEVAGRSAARDVLVPFAESALGSDAAARGLLERSTRLLMLPLLEVSS